MTELTPLPPSIESLTPEWLTAALRNGGALPEGSVTSFGHEIIGRVSGSSGTVARLKLQYSGAGPEAPATAIAKLPFGRPRLAHGRRCLRPLRARGSVSIRTSRVTAACPHRSRTLALRCRRRTGGHHPRGPHRRRFGDQVAGASLAEAELAIDAIGAFHARWWKPGVRPVPLDHLRHRDHPPAHPIDVCGGLASRHGALRLRLPGELRPLIPDFGRRTMAALDRMTLGPETLVHGDYRPDNLFFGAPAAPLVACDWQSPGKATGVVDAAYFITGSMEPADRRKHEDDLLRRYHNQLLEGGVKDYSFDQLKTDFRGYFAGVIAGGVVLLGTLPEGNDRGRRLIESSMNRFISAMQDHDSLALLPE
ncbi:MAG: DUF1679 domain-containing protein [Dehalococcoidia bacterium]|nr:DUF1679 domain-containing protein [Dehalococcoidia bacterium]